VAGDAMEDRGVDHPLELGSWELGAGSKIVILSAAKDLFDR